MTARAIAVAILRFAGLIVLGAVGVAVLSIAVGALLGASARGSVTLGLYAVGSFVLLGGFFIGNRGPIRGAAATILTSPTANLFRRRWATAREQDEAINLSALFVVFGLALIALGIAIDADSDLI